MTNEIFNQDLLAQVSNIDNTGCIDNEIELIQSRSMIAKTIESLDFEVSYFQQISIKKTELYKRTPIKLSYDSIAFNTYEKPLHVRIVNDKSYEITYQDKAKSEGNKNL